MKKIRLGAGSGYFFGDLDQAITLAKKGNCDYICFDSLAELTVSLLQREKVKNPKMGFAPDIIPQLKAIMPLAKEKGFKIISNGGGANCKAAMEEAIKIAKTLGLKGVKIAAVLGDDITSKISSLIEKGHKFVNLDTGEENITPIMNKIVTANAYIGAEKIIEALDAGADVVLTGRASDNALYVGPIMHEFGWRFEDKYWNLIGKAITVGHILECAECCTGGMTVIWEKVPEPWNIGNPIGEFYEDGTAIITKVPGTGGLVNEWTIKEHLVYETHDPKNYIMPDGIADLTTLKLEDLGEDRVRVTNMSGKRRPEKLKLMVGYQDGWIAEYTLIHVGSKVLKQARRTEEIIRKMIELKGIVPVEMRFEYIGLNACLGGIVELPSEEDYSGEIALRFVIKTNTREEAQAARTVAMTAITHGAVGMANSPPVAIRPVVALWPTLVSREEISQELIIEEVN